MQKYQTVRAMTFGKEEKTNLGRALLAYGFPIRCHVKVSHGAAHSVQKANGEKASGSVPESRFQGLCRIRMDLSQDVPLTDYAISLGEP